VPKLKCRRLVEHTTVHSSSDVPQMGSPILSLGDRDTAKEENFRRLYNAILTNWFPSSDRLQNVSRCGHGQETQIRCCTPRWNAPQLFARCRAQLPGKVEWWGEEGGFGGAHVIRRGTVSSDAVRCYLIVEWHRFTLESLENGEGWPAYDDGCAWLGWWVWVLWGRFGVRHFTTLN